MGGADLSMYSIPVSHYNPSNPSYPFRDRFFLIPGICRLCYTLYCRSRVAFIEDLKQFRQRAANARHPEVDTLHGIENTSGPLGQGHAMALGAAIAERFMVARFGEWMAHKTYTYISDGGIQEEISQGVGRIADIWG